MKSILLRSDLQAAIISLSLLAWTSRENEFRLPCLIVFLWISATILKSDRKRRQRDTRNVLCLCNSRRQLADRLNHRVVKIVQLPPLQSPVERGTDISAGQPKLDVIHLIDHRILGPLHPPIVHQRLGEDLL